MPFVANIYIAIIVTSLLPPNTTWSGGEGRKKIK